jgi:hypothetical protein
MTLSQLASALMRAAEASHVAADHDAGFDGGEFSRPAHATMLESVIAQLCATEGYTPRTVRRGHNDQTLDPPPS